MCYFLIGGWCGPNLGVIFFVTLLCPISMSFFFPVSFILFETQSAFENMQTGMVPIEMWDIKIAPQRKGHRMKMTLQNTKVCQKASGLWEGPQPNNRVAKPNISHKAGVTLIYINDRILYHRRWVGRLFSKYTDKKQIEKQSCIYTEINSRRIHRLISLSGSIFNTQLNLSQHHNRETSRGCERFLGT